MEIPLPIGPSAPAMAAPDLTFAIEDAAVMEHAAVPTLRFDLRIGRSGGGVVRSAALNVQLRIAATRRRYAAPERERLVELFGPDEQWGRSLRSLHWTNVAVNVAAFTDSTLVELAVPCTYDLEVTASRYLDALKDGEVPLEFLFSGSVFYAGGGGRLQVTPIAWCEDAEYRMPVAVWRNLMERHFAGTAWLRLQRETFERLHAYRAQGALMSWDEAVESLLRRADSGGAA